MNEIEKDILNLISIINENVYFTCNNGITSICKYCGISKEMKSIYLMDDKHRTIINGHYENCPLHLAKIIENKIKNPENTI